ERAQALAGAAGERQIDCAPRQALIAALVSDLAGEVRADVAIDVGDLVTGDEARALAENNVARFLQDGLVERTLVAETFVAFARVVALEFVGRIRIVQQTGEVDGLRLRIFRILDLLKQFSAADDLVERAGAELGEVMAHIVRHGVEEVDDVLGLAAELGAEVVALRGDADRTGVEMADAEHRATGRDERGGAEVEFFSAEQRGDDDIATGLHAAVGAEHDAVTQAVHHENLVRFSHADFPSGAGVLN